MAPAEGRSDKQKTMVASAYLEPSEIQDLAEVVPKLLDIKAKSKIPIRFKLQLELGDGEKSPSKAVAAEVAKLLTEISENLRFG